MCIVEGVRASFLIKHFNLRAAEGVILARGNVVVPSAVLTYRYKLGIVLVLGLSTVPWLVGRSACGIVLVLVFQPSVVGYVRRRHAAMLYSRFVWDVAWSWRGNTCEVPCY